MAVKTTSIFLVCILATLSTLAVGMKIKYKECEPWHKEKVVQWVDIPSCTSEPCVFHIGKTINASMAFIPRQKFDKGTISIKVRVLGMEIAFPFSDKDICKDHGLDCPLEQGKEYTGNISLYLKDLLPGIHFAGGTAKIMAKDQEKYIFCFQMYVKFKYN